jgi:hypothetical protein
MTKDLILFLQKPNLKDANFTSIRKIWRTALLFCWLILFQIVIQVLFSLINPNSTGALIEYDDKILNHVGFIYIIFLGPIIEELTFRLPLSKFNAIYLKVSCSFLLTFFLSRIIFHFIAPQFIIKYYYEIGFALLIFYCLNKIDFYAIKVFWEERFYYFFWLSALLFSLFHFPYVISLSLDYVVMLKVFVSLFLGAIVIGYTRVRYGFIYGLGIHILYNFFTTTV